MKVIAIGDNCIDEYFRQDEKYVGGCSVNFAVYMRQLGGYSAYIGAVGDDKNGEIVRKIMTDKDVDISHIHVIEGRTAVTKVELVDNDRKFVEYDKGVLSKFAPDADDMSYISGFDLVHTSVYGEIDDFLPAIKEKAEICYDFGDKLLYSAKDTVLNNVDYAFFSYDRDDEYIRSYLKEAYSHNLKCAVATLGGNGSIAYDGDGFAVHGIRKVKVTDTIGAGDSFIAGFMYAALSGMSTEECLQSGAQKAEETIQHFGAIY